MEGRQREAAASGRQRRERNKQPRQTDNLGEAKPRASPFKHVSPAVRSVVHSRDACAMSKVYEEGGDKAKGKQKAADVTCWIVPGSKLVEKQAIAEGLDKIFQEAGIKMRQPGCSACLAMNDDKIPEGKLCISTSNRNFEGRQGQGARTILASPLTAIAAAVHGKIWTADAAIERNQSKVESLSR